jgi:DNA-binding CsgD family transcriptional regulator
MRQAPDCGGFLLKDQVITFLLAGIVLLKLVDIVTDAGLGVPAWHLAQEWALLLLCVAGFALLVRDIRRRTRELHKLRGSLSLSHRKLQDLGEHMRQARREFAQIMQEQFEAWGLTRGEQEVALLLLKGLSLKEIAGVREVREKTVRQQASSIYGKTGLDGRHALSAWFLEDFLHLDSDGTPPDAATSGRPTVEPEPV